MVWDARTPRGPRGLCAVAQQQEEGGKLKVRKPEVHSWLFNPHLPNHSQLVGLHLPLDLASCCCLLAAVSSLLVTPPHEGGPHCVFHIAWLLSEGFILISREEWGHL